MTASVDGAPPEGEGSPDDFYFFGDIAWTQPIEDAAQAVALWINCDQCGASFWGLPRIGKSAFARYFEKSVSEMFAGTVLVVRFRFGGQRFTKADQFWRRALSNLGVRAIAAREIETLRNRLMDEIWARCTPATKRIVVIADEVQNLSQELYGELAFIEGEITEGKCLPFLLSIGQPELQSTVSNVQKNIHIMGRQFQELVEYRGLTSAEIRSCLQRMDGGDLIFTKKHFPARAAKGWSIADLESPLRLAVCSSCPLVEQSYELFFPMAYLRQTLNYVFFFLIESPEANDNDIAAAVLEAFDRNGFKRLIASYVKPSGKPAEEVNGNA